MKKQRRYIRQKIPTVRRVRPTCPYCGRKATLMNGTQLFRDRRAKKRLYWRCGKCDAHVGTHRGTSIPLGTLANKSLRKLRMQTHIEFDKLWEQIDSPMTRTQAYQWLAMELDIGNIVCHIAMFDEDMCRKTLDILESENIRNEEVCCER